MFGKLSNTGGKRLTKGRKEKADPAQALLLSLAWEHPHAMENQEFMGSAKPPSALTPRSHRGDLHGPEQGCVWRHQPSSE